MKKQKDKKQKKEDDIKYSQFAEIAKGIPPEVRQEIIDTPLNKNTTELLMIYSPY